MSPSLLHAALPLVLLAGTSSAQIAFADAAPAGPAAFPLDLELADLDGDGLPDLVQTEADPNAALGIHPGVGDGSFGAGVAFDLDFWGQELALGDVDGDGDTDVLAITQWVQDNLRVLLNDGAGGFAQVSANLVGSSPEDMSLVDLDGDADLDLLLANRNLASLSVLFGDGQGVFDGEILTQVPNSSGDAWGVTAGDLDGDGDSDGALACFGAQVPGFGRVNVFHNPGDGTLTSFDTYQAGGGCWSIEAGDLDGDGDLDLFTTNRNTDTVTVFPNEGAGTFGPRIGYAVGVAPIDGTLADLDGDGDLDAAVPSVADPGLHLLENDGTGVFLPAGVLAQGESQIQVDLADLDGDGDLDLVVGGNDTLLVFANLLADDGAFIHLGNALAGTHGEPSLTGSGDLAPGTPAAVTLAGALENAAASLVVGLSAIDVPFRGGVLVPAPDVVLPLPTTDATGGFALSGTWPSGVPAGAQLVLQTWIVDGAGPKGLAASNGLLVVSP
jgi:hypothetical protein